MSVFTAVGNFTIVSCAECHMPFGVTTDFEQQRRRDHENFYCPKGHFNYWPQKSDIQIERDKAAKLAQQLEVQEHRTVGSGGRGTAFSCFPVT